MPEVRFEIGYLPLALDLALGKLRIETLPGLGVKIAEVEASKQVHKSWFYAPPQMASNWNVLEARPYPSRIFGMPKTHLLLFERSEEAARAEFLIWVLSFIKGVRLTPTEMGFVDATPIRLGALVDFRVRSKDVPEALSKADEYWSNQSSKNNNCDLFCAAVHALFMSQNPRLLQFEQFGLLYTALDTCFALVKGSRSSKEHIPHSKRFSWVCAQLEIRVPSWADSYLSDIRNPLVHEAVFIGKSMGFAIHASDTEPEINLQMHALACRILVAEIFGASVEYVGSQVDTRQIMRLSL